MVQFRPHIPQTDPPRPPRETLPTMYDLPSDDPEGPGLPDEFHLLQPQLLSETFNSPQYPSEWVFMGTDLNIYYDVRYPLRYKRPDWFVAVGISRLYENGDLRNSYVIWQEGIHPFVVVELLSPGTAKEDLGENITIAAADEGQAEVESTQESESELIQESDSTKLASKWEVYEQRLRIPYYVVFSRYTNRLRCFQLVGGRYCEQNLDSQQPRLEIPELEMSLGLWFGRFRGIERLWLRWLDAAGNWIPTYEETAVTAQTMTQEAESRAQEAENRAQELEARLEQERREKEQLLARLRQLEGNTEG